MTPIGVKGVLDELDKVKAERDWAHASLTTCADDCAALAAQLVAAKVAITSLTSERDALAVNFAAAVKALEIYSGALQDDRK